MRRLFSLVVPTYNVERYLGDFLESLAAQTYPLDDIEIVFVDDGSSDSSAEIITKWIAAVAPTARVVHKENGGLSSARNSGLDRVGSRWVTFSDPDDKLSPNYFADVARFLAKHEDEDIHVVACRLLRFDDRTQKLSDTHPLRLRFAKEYRVVDLERHPQHVHLSAASAFYRTDLIEQRRLRFDHRVQPNFEDGHFTGLYLADHERPRVAFLRDPVYHYRRRPDSLVQASWTRPEKFTEVPRYGYLDLLEQVDAKRGRVPVWLQNLVLYDLLWYFKYDEDDDSPLGSVDDDVAGEFHDILPRILRYIDTATIKKYRITSASTEIRNSLIILKGERLRPERLRIGRIDGQQRIAEIRYCYGGELPREEFRRRGLTTRPVYDKCRSLSFVGKRIASERIVWLPTPGRLQVTIDDRATRIRRWSAPDDMEWYRALRWRAALVRRRILGEAARVRGLAFQLRATGFRGGQYRKAWVFADRHHLAGDNAEHLYRYVKVNHPEINAWFVVDRYTKDWSRLEQEGFRLVEYGTPEHRLLMLNCVELISSHIDDDVIKLIDTPLFGARRCRFTFLQHGVTKDDRSRWLNRKPLSRIITATNAEYESIVGDGTPYVFTDREVRLTGFPRHDRLLRIAEDPQLLAADRLLLIMPTWRRQLAGDAMRPGGARVADPGFFESPYATNWLELLQSERLGELAERAGLSIAFVPHPNSTEFLTRPLPEHVEGYRYQDADIQELLARGAVMITDYSSNAFELAYLNRPVIYFQFDPEDFYSGQHIYRRGQWNYETEGFGPVVARPFQVLDELASLVDREMKPAEPYAGRMAQAFAFRDGSCCARVFESIRSMRRPPDLAIARRAGPD